jgi:hypothetical protein
MPGIVGSHSAFVTVINTTNTWSSAPSVPGTEAVPCSWQVNKSVAAEPNTATITLSNLSPRSRDSICEVIRKSITWTPAQLIELMLAGASEAPAIVTNTNLGIATVRLEVSEGLRPPWVWYVGQSTKIVTAPATPTSTLTLHCTDFSDAIGAAQVYPPKSYTAGTPVVTVLVDHIHAMGLSVNPAILTAQMTAAYAQLGTVAMYSTTLIQPLVTAGPAVTLVRRFFDALKLTWMVIDGVLYVLGDNMVLPGYPPLVLSPLNGTLLGSPRRNEDGGLECDSLLRPGLIPGRAVQVLAQGVGSASYRLRKIAAQGSNQSGSSVRLTLETLSTIPGVI